MNSGSATRDWDASTYARVGRPQEEWALGVIDRLRLEGHETVLDAGCGAGRVTSLLIERLPAGRVIAVDGSVSMIERVRTVMRERDRALVADLASLELDESVDAVFSGAVFHWIADHDALFARLYAAMAAGARLEAQCGGAGNIRAFHEIAAAAGAEAPFADHLGDWSGPWNFATPEATRERLERVGFVDMHCDLRPWPVTPEEPRDFVRTVCLGPHLDRLPEDLHEPYLDAVLARWPEPQTLDYIRLNISARRAG